MAKKAYVVSVVLLLIAASFLVISLAGAVPPTKNCTPGTSWCENDAHKGDREYHCQSDGNGGGEWYGPYACGPNAECSGVGTGQNCQPKSDGLNNFCSELYLSGDQRLRSAEFPISICI